MRYLAAVGLVVMAVAAGCGGSDPSPESVVRAWNERVNSGDDEGAADLFAEGAKVIQYGRVRELATRDDAVAWNAGLPCSARIVSLTERGQTVTVTFVLGERERHTCDGPGARARTVFRVQEGKIVLWHQLNGDRPSRGIV